MPFQRSTITFEEVPIPNATRPGAASASEATHCASVAGPRVKDGTMADPSRSEGAHVDASVNGVKPSAPFASLDQTSVYPRSSNSLIQSRWAWSGTPSNGMVMPWRCISAPRVGLPAARAGRFGLGPETDDGGLARGGHERAVV